MVDRALTRSPSWESGTRTRRDSESLPGAGTVRERETSEEIGGRERDPEVSRSAPEDPGVFETLGTLMSYSFFVI